MARRAKASAGVGDHPSEEALGPLVRMAIMTDRTIINGHVLSVGTVVELTENEISLYRAGGIPLDDVAPDDDREVYSVREPYVVPSEEE